VSTGFGRNGKQSGVPVPGGVVTIDLYRGVNPVLWWIWTVVQVPIKGPNWVSRVKRDLVISDESGERELYREGPYNNITVVNPLERIVAEIRADGLDQFLFKRQAEESRIGPLSRPSGQVHWNAALISRYYRRGSTRTHPPTHPPPTD
jgi:hypothetical protein